MEKSVNQVNSILVLIGVFLIISIFSTVIFLIHQRKVNNQNNELIATYLAQFYDPTIRNELFEQVIDGNRAELVDELNDEKRRCNIAIKQLKIISLPYMDKKWQNINSDLSGIWNISHYLRLGYNSPTAADIKLTGPELQMLEYSRNAWQVADSYAKEKNLLGLDFTDELKKNIGNYTAEYSDILSKEFKDKPSLFRSFYKLDRLIEVNISEDVLLGEFYSNADSIQEFRDIVSKYIFIKSDDYLEYKMEYQIHLYYESDYGPSRRNPSLLEIGQDHIRVAGSYWGLYKTDPQFFDEIKQWIANCKGRE